MAAVLAAAVIAGPIAGALVAVVVLSRARVVRLLRARRRRRAIDRELPDSIEMLVLVVHAGMTPHQAIRLLAQRAPPATRPGFTEVVRRIERGASLPDALRALPDELGPEAGVVADTLAMAERHGTGIARALELLAVEVRERRRRRAEAAARSLPVRLSFPLVACILPSFVLVAIVPAVLGALSSLSDTGLRP